MLDPEIVFALCLGVIFAVVFVVYTIWHIMYCIVSAYKYSNKTTTNSEQNV